MGLSYGFALYPLDNSADFSDALHSVTGDGITRQGSRFAAAINGITVTLSSGYALAKGRWLENDDTYTLMLSPSSNTKDRYDAVAVRVDYEARKASLEILEDVDPAALDITDFRSETEYNLLLYLIHVKRGATTLSPDNITDLRANKEMCGYITPLSSVSGKVLYVYDFLDSGIDRELARILMEGELVIDKATAAITRLDAAIGQKRGTAIGDLQTCLSRPSAEWLLCDGDDVPAQYPALSAMLDGVLPAISNPWDRYKTFIFAGAATEV